MRTRTALVAALAAVVLLAGCGQAVQPPAAAAGVAATTTPPPLSDLIEEFIAVFEASEKDSEVYEIFVYAQRDKPPTRTVVEAQGEFEAGGEELYYRAKDIDYGSPNPKAQFTVGADMRSVRVTATMAVESCTDEENQPVTDARCPIGTVINVKATATCNGDLEFSGPTKAPTGKGRKCAVTGTIGEHTYDKTIYSIMTENVTRN